MTLPAAVRLPGTPAVGITPLATLGDAELLSVAVWRPLSVAAGLLERLEGAPGVVTASPSELVAAGLPARRASALAGACELTRRALAAPPVDRWVIRRPADLAERLVPGMGLLEREELRVAVLNTKNVVTTLLTVYVGSLAGSSVRVGEVFREAVRRNGAAVVVAHNHPSGDPTPSAEDLRITEELASAGRLLDIALLDHLIIARDRWVSLRSMGVL
jgi:DNA repair protein RadC